MALGSNAGHKGGKGISQHVADAADEEALNTTHAFTRVTSEKNMTFQESEKHKRRQLRSKMPSNLKTSDEGSGESSRSSSRSARSSSKSARQRKSSLRSFIESQWFEVFVCFLILTNAMVFGYEVEVFVSANIEMPAPFWAIEYTYTALFTIELLLRFVAFGPSELFCTATGRAWNFVDLFLVAISLLEIFIQLTHATEFTGINHTRMMRVFRASRIFRVVRIMKFFRPLRILLDSIVGTLRSICWALVLLAMLIYMFGIVFTIAGSQVQSDGASLDQIQQEELDRYFGSLGKSLSTFFMSITSGIDWQVCMTGLGVLHPLWTMLFIAYVAFSNFGIATVITGIVCQAACESAQHDQDVQMEAHLAEKRKYVDQLRSIFRDMDIDGSGYITLEQFEERMTSEDESLATYFASMDITVDEAWNLFKLLDVDENSSIDLEQFVSGCLRLRGTARGIDLHMLMYESKWTMSKLICILETVEELEARLQKTVQSRRGSTS